MPKVSVIIPYPLCDDPNESDAWGWDHLKVIGERKAIFHGGTKAFWGHPVAHQIALTHQVALALIKAWGSSQSDVHLFQQPPLRFRSQLRVRVSEPSDFIGDIGQGTDFSHVADELLIGVPTTKENELIHSYVS